MYKIISSIFVLSFLFSIQLNGQIFDKLSKTIDQVTDDITEKISEEMVERIIERIFSGDMTAKDSIAISDTGGSSSSPDSSSTSSPSIDLASIFGSSNVDKSKVFTFSHRMKMELVSKDQTNVFDYYFNKDATYLGAKASGMFIVIEMESGKTYTIMNDKLITFNMSSLVEKMVPKGMDESEKFTITRTGKKEVIAGFMCEEIIMESDESLINGWLTQEFFNTNIENVAFIQEMKDAQSDQSFSGAFMRYTFVEKGKEDEQFTMNVIEFVPEAKTVNLADY